MTNKIIRRSFVCAIFLTSGTHAHCTVYYDATQSRVIAKQSNNTLKQYFSWNRWMYSNLQLVSLHSMNKLLPFKLILNWNVLLLFLVHGWWKQEYDMCPYHRVLRIKTKIYGWYSCGWCCCRRRVVESSSRRAELFPLGKIKNFDSTCGPMYNAHKRYEYEYDIITNCNHTYCSQMQSYHIASNLLMKSNVNVTLRSSIALCIWFRIAIRQFLIHLFTYWAKKQSPYITEW